MHSPRWSMASLPSSSRCVSMWTPSRQALPGSRPACRLSKPSSSVAISVIEGDMSFIGSVEYRYQGRQPGRQPATGNTGSALPIDKDGNRFGTREATTACSTAPAVYHDILLNIYGKVSDNAQAVIKIDAGNYLPWLVSATSQDPAHMAPESTAEPVPCGDRLRPLSTSTKRT